LRPRGFLSPPRFNAPGSLLENKKWQKEKKSNEGGSAAINKKANAVAVKVSSRLSELPTFWIGKCGAQGYGWPQVRWDAVARGENHSKKNLHTLKGGEKKKKANYNLPGKWG